MIWQKPNSYQRGTCANVEVESTVDAQFDNMNHLPFFLLNNLFIFQTFNPKQALRIESLKHIIMTNPLMSNSNGTHCSAVCMSYDLQQVHGIGDLRGKKSSVPPSILQAKEKKKQTQRPVSNPKLCKSCGMSP